jgi:hypothetical protein
MTSLDEAVWAILRAAAELYADSEIAGPVLERHLGRFAEPLRVAITGPAGAGRSTLVNALVGEEIAPVATGAFAWYQEGPARRAVEYGTDVVVEWPARDLRAATLIDTPPVDDAVMERVWREADAVLYLVRNVPGTGLRPLRHAQDAWLTRPAPVNAILVLSRADEVGGGRIDALTAARQLARRYRKEVPVRAVCQAVVAVAGLLGVAGRTLRDEEFAALRALADHPREELAEHLLSADRVTADPFPVNLDRAARVALLDRFGLCGIRLCTTLIRTSCPTPATLAAELIRRSGLDELRDCMNQLFLDRRQVLKARSALLALGTVVRADPRPGSRRLLMDLDRALANAHDFQELRLLASLRAGHTTLPAGLDQEARRLLGAGGTDAAARLGLGYEPTEEELWAFGVDALARWREQTENPVFTEDQRRAARLVVRSCESLLTDLVQPV